MFRRLSGRLPLPKSPALRAGPRAAVAALLAGAAIAAMLTGAAILPARAQAPDPQAVGPDFRDLRSEAGRVHTPQDLFVVLDVNQDGCIDDGEWRRRVMAIFFVLDTQGSDSVTGRATGDGQITRAEAPNLRDDLFRAADANHDGSISGFEFNQAGFTRFEAVPKQDRNCLTVTEFTVYVHSLRQDGGP